MTTTKVFLALALFFAVPGALLSQTPGSQAPGQPGQAAPVEPPTSAAPVLQTAAGELSKVDAEAKSFWLKAADGTEMEFKYNESTQVSGAANNAEGLGAMSGARVTVQFARLAGSNVAAKIEVLPRS
jgi:hypothetical protein